MKKISLEKTIVQVRDVPRSDHNSFKAWCSNQGIKGVPMGEVLRTFINRIPKDVELSNVMANNLKSYIEEESKVESNTGTSLGIGK